MLLADQKTREIVTPSEGREEGTEGLFRWERTTKVLEAPDLAPNGTVPRWRVYEIDVRVNWDTRRQVEVRTLRTTPITTELPGAPATPATPATSPSGGGGSSLFGAKPR
jgi:hypothetical protein